LPLSDIFAIYFHFISPTPLITADFRHSLFPLPLPATASFQATGCH